MADDGTSAMSSYSQSGLSQMSGFSDFSQQSVAVVETVNSYVLVAYFIVAWCIKYVILHATMTLLIITMYAVVCQNQESATLMSTLTVAFCVVVVVLGIGVILVFVTGDAADRATEDADIFSGRSSSGSSGGGSAGVPSGGPSRGSPSGPSGGPVGGPPGLPETGPIGGPPNGPVGGPPGLPATGPIGGPSGGLPGGPSDVTSGGGPGQSRPSTAGPPPPVIIMDPIPPVIVMPPTTTPPTTVATRRSGMMFCVVGATFHDKSLFARQYCDYAVYPDLIARNGSLKPIYGTTTWNTFKEAVAAAKDVEVGLGFTLAGINKPASSIDLISGMGAELSHLARTMNASAMGVFNFQYKLGVSLQRLQAAFQAFAAAVSMARTTRLTEPMTFLGVLVTTYKESSDFTAEIRNMKNVTTIILQTHISTHYGSSEKCMSMPVSMMTAAIGEPSFEVAAGTAMSLHALGNRFRIVFSSTLGVMMFVGSKSSGAPTAIKQACYQAFMTGFDVTCNATVSRSAMRGYDQSQHFAYLKYEAGSNLYFATYETEKSLAEKLNMYVVHVSDGWALFEVDRDTLRSCGYLKDDDYPRLTRVQQQARQRQMVDASNL